MVKQNFCPRSCATFWNGFMQALDTCAIFSLWDMVDFVLKLCSELETLGFRNNFMLLGLRPSKPPGSLGALPPRPPTGGSTPRPRLLLDWIPLANWLSGITAQRFWIRFAKHRRPQFTKNFEYKINHISYTEKSTIV